ncbi:MAG TPA: aspartate dehydrogenase [Acetobacteraceae bacterium]|nr:aspartate dehydrogenase [Acetobacteraceae bacterium]
MTKLRVGIAGYGAIGREVARRVMAGVPGVRLAGIAVRQPGAVEPPAGGVAVTDAAGLPGLADVVVECAPAAAFLAIVEPALQAGRTVVVLSCAALLRHAHLPDLARAHGGRILVPTGALLGLDAVAAAAEGTIHSVRMKTRKPPRGLAGAPHLVQNAIEVEGLTAPLMVFSGSARDAAIGFPANVNVAAALSLAGIGPDRTRIEIWADPGVTRNIHRIELDSDAAKLVMEIENLPSENPRTGKITAQSVVALLRKLRATVAIGT